MELKDNYNIFLFANSILALGMGLFGPFWIVFLRDFSGGIEPFGIAVGLSVLVKSLTSYWLGKASDKFGRKIFLIASGYLLSVVILAYTLITSLIQLYLLQIIDGITDAMSTTMETIFFRRYNRKGFKG